MAHYRFALSTADVEDLLADRGATVSRDTVRKWVNRFGRHFAGCIKRDRPIAADKWHLDEVVIPINGTNQLLWRAVDATGDVLDILVQPYRNAKAAKRLLARLIGRFGKPRVVVTTIVTFLWNALTGNGQIAQLHQTDPSTGSGRRSPRPQRAEQPHRGLAQTDPVAREAHGPIQIIPAGPKISGGP